MHPPPVLIEFAENHLGPASVLALEQATTCQLKLIAEDGWEPYDLALALVFRTIKAGGNTHEDLRYEFYGHIYSNCTTRRGLTSAFPSIQSLTNTHDLLGEVILDLLTEDSRIDFLGRASFCTLVWMRMGWKAQQIARKKSNISSAGRNSHLSHSKGSCPHLELQKKEEAAALGLAIGKLHPRERQLINLYLKGASSVELGVEMKMKPATARKAVQRTLDNLGRLLKHQH